MRPRRPKRAPSHHLAAALVLASTVGAQGVLLSPPGYTSESTGSTAYSLYLGGYVQQRAQLADGNIRDKERLLTGVKLRRDMSPGFAMQGRSWSKVTLRLADTDLQQLGATFTANFSSTPTTVFGAAMSWTVPTSSPTPAPWGDSGLSFPFTAPYRYTGKNDLLLDYSFTGGRRSDSQAWAAGTLMSYYLDGVSDTLYHNAQTLRLGNHTCADSAQTAGAVQTLYLQSHSIHSPTHPNQIYHAQEVFRVAPNAAVIQGIGLQAIPAGIDLGSCNKLYLLPAITVRGVSDLVGYARLSLGSAPYDAAIVGRSIFAQSAWADSVHGGLRLTNAVDATIASQPDSASWRAALVCTTTQTSPLTAPRGTLFGRQYLPLHLYDWR